MKFNKKSFIAAFLFVALCVTAISAVGADYSELSLKSAKITGLVESDYTPLCNASGEYNCRLTIIVCDASTYYIIKNMNSGLYDKVVFEDRPIVSTTYKSKTCEADVEVLKEVDCKDKGKDTIINESVNGTVCYDVVMEKQSYECGSYENKVTGYEMIGRSKFTNELKFEINKAEVSDKSATLDKVKTTGCQQVTIKGKLARGGFVDVIPCTSDGCRADFALWQNPSSSYGWNVTNPSGGNASYLYSVEVPLWQYSQNTTITALALANYHLDGNVNDATGLYNGTAVNAISGYPSVSQSDFGTSYYFDGSGDYLLVNPVVTANHGYAIASWLSSNVAQTNLDYNLWFRWSNSTGHDMSRCYWSGYGANNIRCVYGSNGGYTTEQLDYAAQIGASGWHYYVISFNDSANLATLYVDGMAVATDAYAGNMTIPATLATTFNMSVGDRWFSTSEGWSGLIDEVAVYDTPLGSEQVAFMYDQDKWKFQNATNYLSVFDGSSELNWEFLEYNPINQEEMSAGDATSMWRFNLDDGSNTTWTPDVNGINNCSVTSVTSSDSLPNLKESYLSDALTDIVASCGTADTLGGNCEFTVEGWVFPTEASTGYSIVSKETSSISDGWTFQRESAATNRFGIYDYDCGATWVYGLTDANNGQWWHFAITKNCTSKTIKVYTNGALEGSTVMASCANDSGNPFYIGNRNPIGAGSNMKGYYDDFKVYNYERSAEDIKKDFTFDSVRFWNSNFSTNQTSIEDNSSWKLNDNGLVLNYDFSEGAGTTLYDKERIGDTSEPATIGATTFWSTYQVNPNFLYSGYLDGVNDYIEIPNINTAADFTINYWVNVSNQGTHYYDVNGATNGGIFSGFYNTSGYIRNYFAGSASGGYCADNVYSNTEVKYNTVYMITLLYNATNNLRQVYINATKDSVENNTCVIKEMAAVSRFGLDFTSAQDLQGYVAGIRVYNRVLSVAEISALYNDGNGLTYEISGQYTHATVTAVDITPDPAYVNDTFTCTPTGTADSYLYDWYNDGVIITGANSQTLVMNTTYSHVNITCVVTPYTAGNGTTMNDSLILSNTLPELTTPIFNQTSYYTNENIMLSTNHTDNDNDVSNLTIQWYVDAINIYNETQTSITNDTMVNFTLNNANYTHFQIVNATIYAFDGYENSSFVYSASQNITNTNPVFDQALTAQTLHHNTNLSYDVNCSDLDADTITYGVNDTHVTINQSGMITDDPLQSEEGTYNITVSCHDGTYNLTSSFLYTILNDDPVVSTSRLVNATITTTTTPYFTFNYTDTEGDTANATLFINGAAYGNLSNIANNTNYNLTANASLTADANYNWTIQVMDGKDYTNSTTLTFQYVQNYYVDTTILGTKYATEASYTEVLSYITGYTVYNYTGIINVTNTLINGSNVHYNFTTSRLTQQLNRDAAMDEVYIDGTTTSTTLSIGATTSTITMAKTRNLSEGTHNFTIIYYRANVGAGGSGGGGGGSISVAKVNFTILEGNSRIYNNGQRIDFIVKSNPDVNSVIMTLKDQNGNKVNEFKMAKTGTQMFSISLNTGNNTLGTGEYFVTFSSPGYEGELEHDFSLLQDTLSWDALKGLASNTWNAQANRYLIISGAFCVLLIIGTAMVLWGNKKKGKGGNRGRTSNA